jgi:site-specific DNA-methyltransferase (adenine-specific)
MNYFYNEDCIEGAKKHIKDNSVDLIITDPPYGINGHKMDKHYKRNESFVLDGYTEVPSSEYPEFSRKWIKQAERVLRPGGSIYILSGYTQLRHVLNALAETSLKEINHLIWKYNFGVYTSKKYISSHYHILFYEKPNGERTFNTYALFSDEDKSMNGGSQNYIDREDVWIINKEYKPSQVKNKNELPHELLKKMILYSSNEKDIVCDFFLGSFSTAKVANLYGRHCCGFEINKKAFDHQITEMSKIQFGSMLSSLRKTSSGPLNRGKPLTLSERNEIYDYFLILLKTGITKKDAINQTGTKYGRGYWSIVRIIEREEINRRK